MKIPFLANRLLVPILFLAGSFATRPLLAQEAVTDKPVTETEETETPTEEATPAEETTPAAETEKESSKQKKSAKDLRQMMTPEEFSAAGLDKLSPEELEKLNSLLQGYRKKAETKAAEKAAAEATAKATKETTKKVRASFFGGGEPIVSRVDGTMIPLTGHTVIRLEDGTRWKQANIEDRYRPRVSDRPAVLVVHTAFGYKMRIEGMPDFYVNPAPEKNR